MRGGLCATRPNLRQLPGKQFSTPTPLAHIKLPPGLEMVLEPRHAWSYALKFARSQNLQRRRSLLQLGPDFSAKDESAYS